MELKYKSLYTNVLAQYAGLSTCDRLHVAAILVKDGRILSVGYNGVPKGQLHCTTFFRHDLNHYYHRASVDDDFTEVSQETYSTEHHKFAEKNEIHAEMNCLAFALRNKIDLTGCEMVLSVSPCMNCAKLIVSSGIKKVYWCINYDRSLEGRDFLVANGIQVERWDPKEKFFDLSKDKE